MMPRTIHDLDPMVYLSFLQKAIRRGLEREAMGAAVELGHTSKAFFTMVCNRLEVILHEDIGLADVPAVQFCAVAIGHARSQYDPEKPGKWRMMIGNAIRAMCRAAKSREGDHFQAACGVPNLDHGVVVEIPDWAHDIHTLRGRKLGRGLEHFRLESARLTPPAAPDVYEDEAYALWAAKANGG